MALRFLAAAVDGLFPLTADVPPGAVVGLVGEETPALMALLELAGGILQPTQGAVEATAPQLLCGPAEPLPDSASVLALPHLFSRSGFTERVHRRAHLDRLRRSGASILLSCHEHDLLRSLCDELWWIDNGRLALRGAPAEVLAAYQAASIDHLRAASPPPALAPSLRRGDGRAQLLAVETLDANLTPTVLWRSGEPVAVRLRIRFAAAVDDPVAGIMIRTRIGFEVFGTNTELENLSLGPCAPGDERSILFRFACALCPQEYTLTAASHDRDGVWHDWMEDAVAFTVADTRYTAGVANLRATAEREDSPTP